MDNNESKEQAQPVLCECEAGVAWLTLNRPAVLNAFSDEIRAALLAQLTELAQDESVRCVAITGAGRAFSAGGDIANMVELQRAEDAATIATRIDTAGQVMATIRKMPKPVVAAINGPAAGGGLNLALGCDMRLASTRAVFSEAFVKIGLVPDWGGFHALPRLVGTAKAMELMMTGERLDAEEALRLGLVNHLFDAEAFEERARGFAARLAQGPAEAVARIKAGVYLGASGSPGDVVHYERETQTALFLSADAREGMQAFLEKRPPKFS